MEGVGDEGDAGGSAGAVGGRQVHRQVAQPPGAGGEQVFLRGGGAPLGQADAAAGAQVDQVGEPFGAGLGHLAGVRVGGIGGGAAAELVDPGGLDWLRVGVQAGELLAGVGGEGAGGGAVRYAVAARRCGGRHQVIADGLAQPGAQPGGQPGAGADGRQRLGESALLAAGAVAVPACLAPAQQYLAVPDEHVTRRGPRPFLDPRRGPAALRAATRGSAGGVGDHVRYRPAVPVTVTAVTSSPGIPSSAAAIAQDAAQPAGAACAGPAQPVASTKAVPFADSGFLVETRIAGEPLFRLPVYVIHSYICGHVDRPPLSSGCRRRGLERNACLNSGRRIRRKQAAEIGYRIRAGTASGTGGDRSVLPSVPDGSLAAARHGR